MEDSPSLPDVEDAPSLLDGGHLWLHEFVDGYPIRFQLDVDGRLRFADGDAVTEPRSARTGSESTRGASEFRDDVPRAYSHAVHHVQRALDRGALRDAVTATETVTFAGVATSRNRVAYDWERLPSVLVTDVHDANGGEQDGGRFLPPARVEQVVERLGLAPVNVLAKEVRATDFDPAGYEFPASAWRDGPVAGVVLRNKTGQRALLRNDDVLDGAGDPATGPPPVDDAERAAARYAPESRYRRVARELDETGAPASFDAVQERVLDGVYREHAPQFADGRPPVDLAAFEQAVARRTSEFLAGQ